MKLPCVMCYCDVDIKLLQDLKLNDFQFREQCQIFCKYFNLSPTQFECQLKDGDDDATVCIFRCCQNCFMSLSRLMVFNEQIKLMQQNIKQIIADVSANIITHINSERTRTTSRENVPKNCRRSFQSGQCPTEILQPSDGEENNSRKLHEIILSIRHIIWKQYSPSVIVKEFIDRKSRRRRGNVSFATDHVHRQDRNAYQKTVGAKESGLDLQKNLGQCSTDDDQELVENYLDSLETTCDDPSSDLNLSKEAAAADTSAKHNFHTRDDDEDDSRFSQETGEEDDDDIDEPPTNKKRRLAGRSSTMKKFSSHRPMNRNRSYRRVVQGKEENDGKLLWGKWMFEPTTNNNGDKGFQCCRCGAFKTTQKSMLSHFYYHEIVEKKLWTCKFCHRVCGSQGNLAKHEKTHGNIPPDLGIGQNIRSLAPWTLVPVIRGRTSRKSEKKSTNNSSSVLGNKWKISKLVDGTFSCETCGTNVKSHNKIVQHIKTVHMEKKPLICPIADCGKIVISGLHEFLGHCKIHPTLVNDSQIIPCGGSKFLYGHKWFFESIQNNDDIYGQPQYKCCTCGLLVQAEEEMLDHLKHAHENPQKRVCPLCNMECKDKKSLTWHLRRHEKFDKNYAAGDGSSNGVKVLYYEYKGRKWPYLMMGEIDGGGQFQCRTEDCNGHGRTVGIMQKHIRIVHAGETEQKVQRKKVVCEICGVAVAGGSYFKVHQKLHSSDPGEFICDVCGVAYRSINLLRHHKEKHQLWKCEGCEATFSYKDGLDKHLKKYCTGFKRKFDCPHCKRFFRTADRLAKHLAKDHQSKANYLSLNDDPSSDSSE